MGWASSLPYESTMRITLRNLLLAVFVFAAMLTIHLFVFARAQDSTSVEAIVVVPTLVAVDVTLLCYLVIETLADFI